MLSADFTNKEVMIMDRKYIKLLIISFVFMVICLGRNNALNVYAVELPVIPIGEESSESNDNSNKEDTQLPIVEENEESSGQKDTTENKKDDSKKQENGQTEEKSGTNKKTDTNAGSSTDGKADTNTGSDTDQKDNKGGFKILIWIPTRNFLKRRDIPESGTMWLTVVCPVQLL